MRAYVLPLLLVLALSPAPTAPEPLTVAVSGDQVTDREFEVLYRQAVAAMEDLRRASVQRPTAQSATF